MGRQNIYIDKTCYEQLLKGMNHQQFDDTYGEYTDLDVFNNDAWLLDSAVIDHIVERRGNWSIYLVFAYCKYPMRLIKRKITSCFSQQKAELAANHMRRLAAKDQRGTLIVNPSDFYHCSN
tara:strand:+ start:1638 stop:2000 length:363 start_codon:yes stop_codon:yes gene_type:complete